MSTTNDPALGGSFEPATGEHATGEQIVAMFETYERARDARERLVAEGVPATDIHLLNNASETSDSTLAYERSEEGFWGALKRLFVPEEHASGYAEGLRRGQAMLSVRPPAGMRERVVERLESFDPIDFDAQEAEWRNTGWSGHGAMGRSGMDRPALEPNEAPTGMGETAALAGGSGTMDTTSGLAGTTRAPMPSPATPPETLRTGDMTSAPADLTGMPTDMTEPPVETTGRLTDAPLTDDADRRADMSETTRPTATGAERESVPVVEEQLAVGKREVSRGRVRVRTYVTERPVEQDVTLREERVNVERRPVDRAAGTVPADAFRERTIEVAATGEEAVVSKEARVIEEVVVSKDQTSRTETVRDTVRKTEVEVEDGTTTGSGPGARKPAP